MSGFGVGDESNLKYYIMDISTYCYLYVKVHCKFDFVHEYIYVPCKHNMTSIGLEFKITLYQYIPPYTTVRGTAQVKHLLHTCTYHYHCIRKCC